MAWWAGCDNNNLGTTQNPSPFSMTQGGCPKSPKFCARIFGHMGSNKAPWPFSTLNINTSPQSQPTDLSKYKGIQFMVKGDGGKYNVQLEREAVKDYAHFAFKFQAPQEWKVIRVEWNKFSQPEWGQKVPLEVKDVQKISFHPQVNDKDYDLSIDEFYYWK
jgi:hypothetical protein